MSSGLKRKRKNKSNKNGTMEGMVQTTFADFSFMKRVDVPNITKKIIDAAKTTANEMGFREEVWPILRNDILEPLGINYDSKKSAEARFHIAGSGVMDRVLGYVIIEYESPGSLSKSSKYKHALEQLIGPENKTGYIEKYSKEKSFLLI